LPHHTGYHNHGPTLAGFRTKAAVTRNASDLFCSLLRKPKGRLRHGSSSSVGLLLLLRVHFWASGQFLRPRSRMRDAKSAHCAASTFPVSPERRGSLPECSHFALGAAASRFWVPQKMGQKKETFSCPTYMLSGIASGCGPLADVPVIRARVVFPWPLPERRPATPWAARLGQSGGSGPSVRRYQSEVTVVGSSGVVQGTVLVAFSGLWPRSFPLFK
jgi:hypothetical protein